MIPPARDRGRLHYLLASQRNGPKPLPPGYVKAIERMYDTLHAMGCPVWSITITILARTGSSDTLGGYGLLDGDPERWYGYTYGPLRES